MGVSSSSMDSSAVSLMVGRGEDRSVAPSTSERWSDAGDSDRRGEGAEVAGWLEAGRAREGEIAVEASDGLVGASFVAWEGEEEVEVEGDDELLPACRLAAICCMMAANECAAVLTFMG